MENTGFSFNYGLALLLIIPVAVAIAAAYISRTRRRTRPSDAPLYIEALQAMVAGEDSTAFSKLKEVIAINSGNLDAYLNIGDILRRHRKVDRAIRLHEELTLRQGLTSQQRRSVCRSLALDYIAAENIPATLKSLEEMLKLDKADQWAAEKLVRVYEDSDRWEEAFQMRSQIDRRLAQNHNNVLALYKVFRGERLAAKGERHQARVVFKEALGLDEKCLPALIGIGDAYFTDGRLADAVEWWSKLLAAQPRAGYLVFDRLKKAYFELGQYGEITLVFEKTLENDPKNLAALAGLAEIASKKGDLREAESHYRRMLEIAPDNIVARTGLIGILNNQSDAERAAEEIERLLQSLPFRPRGYRCRKCTFKSLEPAWRCPQCKSLDSFKLWDEET